MTAPSQLTSVDYGKPSRWRTAQAGHEIPRIRVAEIAHVDGTQPRHGRVGVGALDRRIMSLATRFGAAAAASSGSLSPATASAPTASAPEREQVGDGGS
jgi:hypothetical protein